MKEHIYPFLTALRFLTIAPVRYGADRDESCFLAAPRYFAPIGFCIGIVGYLLAVALDNCIPPQIFCAFAILYLSGISGFLHLDGLADCGDGFFSARPAERILQIMKDSRIGAMGVVSLFLLLLFKFAAFLSLSADTLPATLLLMPLAGRCAIVLSMRILPYARPEGGIGKLFYVRGRSALFSSALFFFLSLLLVPVTVFAAALAALLVTVFLFSLWCRKKIGGATGDTLGAVCELTEAVTAIFIACITYSPATAGLFF